MVTNVDVREQPVVVGVDGSPSALNAVRWAAHEAARRGAVLRLVHVCHLVPVRHPRQVAAPADYRQAVLDQGRHWLLEAEEAARHTEPDLAVTTDQHDGSAADLLIGESRTAQLVVLGSRGLGGFSAMLVGSVAVALAAHGHCPVVVLRATDTQPPASWPVLVGVDSSDPGDDLSDAALTFPFEAAAARGVPLVAVHTWTLDNVASAWPVIPDTIDWDHLHKKEEQAFAEHLAPWREKYPGVEVHATVERDRHPHHALVRRSAGAQLVVVGSRGRGAVAGLGLGSVSQSLLHHAECPVAVARTE